MVREIVVIKKPRDAPIVDKPISFPPLQNLHLDLMENKKKLKKGLPAIQVVKKKPVAAANVVAAAAALSPPAPEKKPPSPKKEEPPEPDDAAMLDELGDEDPEGPEELELDEKDISSPQALGPGEVPAVEPPKEEVPVEEPEVEDDPYSGLTPEEREIKEKEEYIWRFRILKKQHKTRDIPAYNEHDDLATMKTSYERTIREIHLESSVESYRTYLIGGFMVMEFVCVNWMGVDLTGFASQQMLMMDRYDRLLIELGERSYNRWGMNLPVELRLICFILLQAGLFYLGKIIADKAGSSMADLFRGIAGQQPKRQSTEDQEEEVPRKKMRGPSIKMEDIKKMSESE